MIRRLLLLAILAPSVAFATIRFEGNRHFSVKELRPLIQVSSAVDSAIEAIETAYIEEGFLTAGGNVSVSEHDTLVTIREGRRFTIEDMRPSGIDDSLAARIGQRHKRSEPLTRERLEQITREAVRDYANEGYPFAQVEIEGVKVLNHVAEIRFHTVRGPYVTVGQIEFPGIKTTKPVPLRRRIDIQTGRVYREIDLLATEAALARMRHCYPMGVPVLTYESRDNTVLVQLPMRDERSLAFDGFAYLQSDNSVAGQANVELINLLGRGEEAAVFWSRAGEPSSKLNLRLLWPYVGDYPVDLEGRLSQEDRDSSYISTSAQIDGIYHLSDDWNVGIGFRWEKVTPEEGRQGASARLMAVDLSTVFDQRDVLRQTHRGALFSQHIVSAFRRSFADAGGVISGYSTQLDGDIKTWSPLSRRLVFHQRLHYFQTASDFRPIPLDQLTAIGGSGSLRGYRENSFPASRGLVSSSELQWHAMGNFMLHLFSDNGYIRDLEGDRRLSGFGAGIVVMTTIGDFRFELSFGEEKRINKVLVHLGMETRL